MASVASAQLRAMTDVDRLGVVVDLYRRHRSVERVALALGVPLRTLQRAMSSTPGLRAAVSALRAAARGARGPGQPAERNTVTPEA